MSKATKSVSILTAAALAAGIAGNASAEPTVGDISSTYRKRTNTFDVTVKGKENDGKSLTKVIAYDADNDRTITTSTIFKGRGGQKYSIVKVPGTFAEKQIYLLLEDGPNPATDRDSVSYTLPKIPVGMATNTSANVLDKTGMSWLARQVTSGANFLGFNHAANYVKENGFLNARGGFLVEKAGSQSAKSTGVQSGNIKPTSAKGKFLNQNLRADVGGWTPVIPRIKLPFSLSNHTEVMTRSGYLNTRVEETNPEVTGSIKGPETDISSIYFIGTKAKILNKNHKLAIGAGVDSFSRHSNVANDPTNAFPTVVKSHANTYARGKSFAFKYDLDYGLGKHFNAFYKKAKLSGDSVIDSVMESPIFGTSKAPTETMGYTRDLTHLLRIGAEVPVYKGIKVGAEFEDKRVVESYTYGGKTNQETTNTQTYELNLMSPEYRGATAGLAYGVRNSNGSTTLKSGSNPTGKETYVEGRITFGLN